MKKLCFGRQPADTRYRYHPGMPFSEGLPRSNSTTFSTMSRNFYLTSNKGNMLIGEGSCRIFDYDRNHSCMLTIKNAERENDELASKIRALECLVEQLKATVEKAGAAK